MTNPAFIICFLILFLFSIYLGFAVGDWAGRRALSGRAYWLYNLAAVLICVLATALIPWPAMLYATPLGLLAGALVGLKMGYGESTGPWKLLDRFFNVNRAHRETTRTGAGAARRARRRAGEQEPDLISVAEPGTGAASGTEARATGKRAAQAKRKKR